MEIRVTYIANDGREFDSKEDCLRWEYKCEHLPESWVAYDKDGIKLDIQEYSLRKYPVESLYDDSFFLFIKDTPHTSAEIGFMYREFGIGDPHWGPGYYIVDEHLEYQSVTYEEWRAKGGPIIQ